MTHRRSPRKRYLVALPDEPLPHLETSAVSQLALLVVIVNIGACLIALHAQTATGMAQIATTPVVRPDAPAAVVDESRSPETPRAAIAVPVIDQRRRMP